MFVSGFWESRHLWISGFLFAIAERYLPQLCYVKYFIVVVGIFLVVVWWIIPAALPQGKFLSWWLSKFNRHGDEVMAGYLTLQILLIVGIGYAPGYLLLKLLNLI